MRSLTERRRSIHKAQVINSLRPKYPLNELLSELKLPRSTFYDCLKRAKKPDKYTNLKEFILKAFQESDETYGYRRIHREALKAGFKISPNTILRLMGQLKLSVTLYSRHTSGYSSYRGKIGTVNDNLLKQKFDETTPFAVMHTDITQVRLADGTWGYISAVLDQASREILTAVVSKSANKEQLNKTIENLSEKLPMNSNSILHSDQGWQYQTREYQEAIKQLGIVPSMSRKGNCHDNAPIESFFSLMKRERLNRRKLSNFEALVKEVEDYIDWYNNHRISLNKNGLTPVEYRNRAAA
ncbi:IS3 family transposase [Amylolactobacillus amylophilus]|uniref:IS3 family transposase n=1 Tax=Amylolactobacillus amylophilus TaxID=1603 RepID=UPI0025AF4135|nr:IS3 family transposase [Amylolactobacillus amylophilus]